MSFDYNASMAGALEELKKQANYRIFAHLERHRDSYPLVTKHEEDGTQKQVVVWCSNDYLGMGTDERVKTKVQEAVARYGNGTGGTRNISGTHQEHFLLEQDLARLHGKDRGLLFTSGYVANYTTLSTLGRRLSGLVYFSDSGNHNSMIEGIRHSGARKHIFPHNDIDVLESQLSMYGPETPKIIVTESVYSMDGDIAALEKIIQVKEKHGALLFLDEVHAVGLYGPTGGGIAEAYGLADQVDILQGTLAKAFGSMGGYIVGSQILVDFIRSFGFGFIFTTSLPPALVAGAREALAIVRQTPSLRARHQGQVQKTKDALRKARLPMLETRSHIVPILVHEARLCRAVTDYLLREHSIYVQPINYPTVPIGMERLRLTPSPLHRDTHIEHLLDALRDTWRTFEIPFKPS